MKYLILFAFLLITTTFCQATSYLIQTVITEDYTKPGDSINVGDTLFYLLDTENTFIEGSWKQVYRVIDGAVLFDKPDSLFRTTQIEGDYGETIYNSLGMWEFKIEGKFKEFGEKVTITETDGHGYTFTAKGMLYDWYGGLPVEGVDYNIKSEEEVTRIQNHSLIDINLLQKKFKNHDLLGRKVEQF